MASITCGQCKATHGSAAEVRDCYTVAELDAYSALAEAHAEVSYLRHLEDRGAAEDEAFEAWERSRGVVGFSEAWDLAGR